MARDASPRDPSARDPSARDAALGGPRPYRFGDLLALARREWIRQVAGRVGEAGYADYRPTDAPVLRLLRQGALPIGQLAEAIGVTRQAARQLADGLVNRGYAVLTSDPGDGRRRMVVLTPRGEDYGRAVWEAQDKLNDSVCRRLSARDLAVADSVLRAVLPPVARQRIDRWMPPPSGRDGDLGQ